MRPRDFVEGLKGEQKLYGAAGSDAAEAICTVGIAILLVLDGFWVQRASNTLPRGLGPEGD